MNEERRQAYLNLIQSLLNCPSGEGSQILQTNSELVDVGLVQVMQVVAEKLRNEGNENAADYLTNVASQLAEWLASRSANYQLKFLLRVLQATSDSNGDSKVIYPLLSHEIKLVNDNLAIVLQNWVRETLSNSDSPKKRINIMVCVFNLSLAIEKFRLGSIASNFEIAIAGLTLATALLTIVIPTQLMTLFR